jgi:hypothetical protein
MTLFRVSTDNHRFPCKFRAVPYLYRSVKTVHVKMEDNPAGGIVRWTGFPEESCSIFRYGAGGHVNSLAA